MRGLARRHNWRAMSALPPTADIGTRSRYVRFVPKADIGPSLDHLVGTTHQRWRQSRTHKMGGRHCRKCLRSTAALLEVTFSYFQDHLYDLLIRLHPARNFASPMLSGNMRSGGC